MKSQQIIPGLSMCGLLFVSAILYGSPGGDRRLPSRIADGTPVLLDVWARPSCDLLTAPPIVGNDDFPIDSIAAIYGNGYIATFGDTDHDGLREMIVPGRILEEQGNNVYDEFPAPDLMPWRAGDLDWDGKADIVYQDGVNIVVYESPTVTSHPSLLVWSSPEISNLFMFPGIGDTDRDGRMEIITSENPWSPVPHWLWIFENSGDNQYDLVYREQIGQDEMAEKAIGDLDRDGRIEIAFSGAQGVVYVLESPGDNQWVIQWTESTELFYADAAEVGRDGDRNGWPELFIMGNGPNGWTTIVYEATGDTPGSFDRVATLTIDDGTIGWPRNTLGNLDGIKGDEYIMETAHLLWVYQADPDVDPPWQLVQSLPEPFRGSTGPYAFDANRNGKDEVFWCAGEPTPTVVYEHVWSSLSAADDSPSRVRMGSSLQLIPNPGQWGAHLEFRGSEGARRLSIYGIDGRLLERYPINPLQLGQLTWPNEPVGPGVYLFRLEDKDGQTLATTKGIVVR